MEPAAPPIAAAAARRPSSTRGRPPPYAATSLEPMCHAWFKYPKHDPRDPALVPTQTIGPGHQAHYKDACLRRILEAAPLSPGARSRLTIDAIKDLLQQYLNHPETNLTDAQRDFLFTEYYTDAYLNTFHTAYLRAYGTPGASPSSSPVPVSAPSTAFTARFQPIQAELKKKKYKRFQSLPISSIAEFLYEFKDTIKDQLMSGNDPEYIPYKVKLLPMVYLLTSVVHVILSLEQPKYLKPRYIANLLNDVKDWTDAYKPKPTYAMTKWSHFMGVFLQYLKTYLSTKERLGKLYMPLTPDERLELLRAIKIKCIVIHGLQAFANTPAFIQTTLDFLTGVEDREVYQYTWFLLTEAPLVYPKRLYDPLPLELMETACIQRFSAAAAATAANLKTDFTERCSVLVQTDCAALTEQREKLMKKLRQKYTVVSPRTDIDYNQHTFPVRVRRPHALMDFFKLWVAHAVVGKRRVGFWLQYLDVRFEGEEGYFVGVQTDLLQTCMDALHPEKKTFASPLFLPVEDGGSRHRFARDLAFHARDIADFQGFLDLNDTESKKLFYEFVGGLMARCFLESIEAPVKLSYFTLAYLAGNRHMEPEDYGFYFAMDMPAAASSYINLLSYDASVIDSLEMTENDVYPLAPSGNPKTITATTLIPYIYAFGKYSLTVVQPGDPAVIPLEDAAKYAAAGEQTIAMLNAWTRGFFVNVGTARAPVETIVRLIDPLISTGGSTDPALLKHWAKHCVRLVLYPYNNTLKRTTENASQVQIYFWVKEELLGNPLLPLPYDAILPEGVPPPTTPEAKKRFYYTQFIPQLLYFWTGSRTIHTGYMHTIQFILNDPTDVPATAPNRFAKKYQLLNAHPVAHTCSKTIDLPTYLIDFSRQKAKYPGDTLEQIYQRIPEERLLLSTLSSYLNEKNNRWKTILLRRLCTAMYQSHGFGMAGGRARTAGAARKTRKTRKNKK